MQKLALLLFMAALSACGGGGGADNTGTGATNPVRSLQDKLQGVWQQRGYGVTVRVSGSSVERFDTTSQTCFLTEKTDLDELAGLQLSEDESTFAIRPTELDFAEHYYKTDSLPAPCDSPVQNNSVDIYQHVWHSFNEYYAFFQERNVDWLAQRDLTRDLVNDATSDARLFEVLSTLILPLDDEHVFLDAGEQYFDPARSKGFLLQLVDEFNAQKEVADVNQYVNLELQKWDLVTREYYLDGAAASAADEAFLWGKITDRIGYLRMDAMILNLTQRIEGQVKTVEGILDKIMTQMADTQGMIVDLRLNGGGADPVAFAIARRFADTERLVVSKFTRTAEGEGPRQDMYLGPVDRPSYLKPVVVITSKFSTSAAEVFTLAMRAWPQVTHIGEATNGSLSDVLEKPLPNGWLIGLANEVYLDGEGNGFEASGIPPHIPVPVFRLEERRAGRDSALEAALELLESAAGLPRQEGLHTD